MNIRAHAAALNEAAIRWAAGDRTKAEDDALADACDQFRRARGDYGPGNKPRDLHQQIVHQLVVHKVPATGEAIAACRTFASGYIALAEADRDLLTRLVHAVESTVIEDGSPALRRLLDEAYDAGVERPAEPAEPACERCGCTSERGCDGGCFWASLDPALCSACLTAEELDQLLGVLLEQGQVLGAQLEHLFQQRAGRIVLPGSGTNMFADWAARVGLGENPDRAAVAVGGTGRPR